MRPNCEAVEENLRARLAQGDVAAGSVQPVLRHLLGKESTAVFGDEVLARVRGMVEHMAHQLIAAATKPAAVVAPEAVDQLSGALLEHGDLLAHVHALALEWQIAERLEQHLAIDPVVPPLLQAMIASPEPQTQDLAMKLLTSHTRWSQGHRRMQLALTELPSGLLHEVLLILQDSGADAQPAANRLPTTYDENASRLALAASLVTTMGSAATVALDLRHAGSTLFFTALALGSGQPRDAMILAAFEKSATRLMLSLRAAGQGGPAIGQQLFALLPEAVLDEDVARLSSERAAAILAGSGHARR